MGLGDPNAFRAIFFEETQDHLANVEAILLRLDPAQPYLDDLNAIFRAVHSIKGSAAMLGCADMAALTHLQENLLDVLRKNERALEQADVEALLKAGDTVQAQALRHRGVLDQAPDSTPVEALLRERVNRPRADAPATAVPGPVVRAFRVRLGPLEAAVAEDELQTLLAGLGEMGQVSGTVVDNTAGGSVAFEVEIEGTATDLQEVLSLVVAPGQIAIERLDGAAPAVPAATAAPVAPAAPAAATITAQDHGADEFFVDPVEFRRGRAQALQDGAGRAVTVAAGDGQQGDEGGAAEAAEAAPPALVAAAEETIAAATAAADAGFEYFVQPEDFRRAARPTAADVHDAVAAASAAADTTYIRVATEKIDLLVNLVGELVITEAMLNRSGRIEEERAGSRFLENGLADLTRHTRNLQEAVMAIRMLPISNVFARFPRLVHELSGRLDKRVELRMSGETTELDRGLIEKISDPLTHLVRNAIDHGIESPEDRREAGKPEAGLVLLRASQRGGNIVIEVSDDGRGLDRRRILARAAERGIPIADDAPDAEVWDLVFEAGFSTAREITDISGRGVGMDVVRRNIKALGGTVDLASQPGQGTTVRVSVPLTLAIMEAMIVGIAGVGYVLPLAAVVESRSIEPGQLHELPGLGETLRVRDEYLPVVRLAEVFPPPGGGSGSGGIAIIVEVDGAPAALVVDELIGQQQVVVKSLETNFRKVAGLSGATVMGDGSVALILDVSYIVRLSGR